MKRKIVWPACLTLSLGFHLGAGALSFSPVRVGEHFFADFLEVSLPENKAEEQTAIVREIQPARPEDDNSMDRGLNFSSPETRKKAKVELVESRISEKQPTSNNEGEVFFGAIDLGNFDDTLPPFVVDYASVLRMMIRDRVFYPEKAYSENMEGKVEIDFVLRDSGYLGEIGISSSSRNSLLDRAAVEAVRKAAPFPPFPRQIRARELAVKIPIVYRVN